MKVISGAVASAAFLILAACGDNDSDSPGAAAPDVSSQTTPAPLPLPPETEPLNPDSGLAPVAPLPADTAG